MTLSVPVDSTMRSPPTEKPSVRSSSVSPTRVSASAPATEKRTSAGEMASARPRKIWNISASRSSASPSPSHRPVSGSITSTTRGEKFCKVELSKSVNASANCTSSDVVRPWSSTTLSAAELTKPVRVAGFRAPRAIARSIDAVMNACCRSIRPKSELPTVTNAPSLSS